LPLEAEESHMSRFLLKFLANSTIIILFCLMPVRLSADELANVIKLPRIHRPFSFAHLCVLPSGDMWLVGGGGQIQHVNKNGSSRKRQIGTEDFNAVVFVNENIGWIVGEHGTILHTNNSGKLWNTQVSGTTKALQSIDCIGLEKCWVVGEAGIVLRTHDHGEHWIKVQSHASASLFAVDFVTAQIGWASGADGVVIHTTDGGQTWQKQQAKIVSYPKSQFSMSADLVALRFVNKNRGWVAGTGGIASTLDGGKTWQIRSIPSNVIGFALKGTKTVWAVSREGPNYVTKDGGLTWLPAS
jgi:photosystem II stability/assembly factor-like uncharacterized protein